MAAPVAGGRRPAEQAGWPVCVRRACTAARQAGTRTGRPRRDAAGPAFLLAAATGRRPRAGTAHRPVSPAGADLPRHTPRLPAFPRCDGGAQSAEPPGKGHLVHDPAGRLSGAVVPLQRPGRRQRGHRRRQPQPPRGRTHHRPLHQHPGAARRSVRRSHLPRAVAAGAPGGRGRLRPSRRPLRGALGPASSPARPQPHAPVPGPVHPAELPHRDPRAARTGAERAGRGQRDGQDGADAHHGRQGGCAARRPGVQHRSL